MKVIMEEFPSARAYAETVRHRPLNKVWGTGAECSSLNTDRFGFTQSQSYEDSVQIMERGYHEGFNQMQKFAAQTDIRGNIKRSMPFSDVVGFAAHVPNAISGIPQSMINQRPIEVKAKVITILHMISVSCATETSEIIKAGVNLLSVVNALELEGYRVGIYYCDVFVSGSEVAMPLVKIKDYRQPSNPLALSYPLVHPSMFRRQGFRFLETTPELTNRSFIGTYGVTFSASDCGNTYKKRTSFLREHGILKNGWFLSEFELCSNKSGHDLMVAMGIKKQADEK